MSENHRAGQESAGVFVNTNFGRNDDVNRYASSAHTVSTIGNEGIGYGGWSMYIVAVHRESTPERSPVEPATYKVWFADFSDKTRWRNRTALV